MREKTDLVSSGCAGIDDQRGKRRQPKRRPERLADAAHHPRGGTEADRHVRARRARRLVEPGIVALEPVQPREQPQRGGGIGRTAADAGGDRQPFHQVEGADAQSLDARPRVLAPP